MFDAGFDSDVGSDQQLQNTDSWKLLRDSKRIDNENLVSNIYAEKCCA